MRPKKIVLLEAHDEAERGCKALLLATWGYAVASPLRCSAEPACVLLCGFGQVSDVRVAMEICLARWQDELPVLVVGAFVAQEREALQNLGVRVVLAEMKDCTLLRETLASTMARKRGPKPGKKGPSSVLAPLSVAMEAAV